MVTASQDGLLIIWDTNKLSFVNSIHLNAGQPVYKVCISETTNDMAFLVNNPNKLCFYTGNCELIGEASVSGGLNDSSSDSSSSRSESNVTMKSLCFSNHTEGNSKFNFSAILFGFIIILITGDISQMALTLK